MLEKSMQFKKILPNIIGSAILAFGLYHVHSISGVTEGGILGLTLLLKNAFSISPAVSGLILNAVCYAMGYKVLGRGFIAASIISGVSFSLFYFIFEQFPPLYPNLSRMPLLAAITGALFVGVGVGLCVRAGGAPSGDDALAMSLSALSKKDIRLFYFISDAVVLLLSLTYIEPAKIFYSFITVILSGYIVGLFQTKRGCSKMHRPHKAKKSR